jgi:hypothetical protein
VITLAKRRFGNKATPKEHKFAVEVVKNSLELSDTDAAAVAYKEVYKPGPNITESGLRAIGGTVLNRPAVRSLIDSLQQGVRYQFILMAPAAQDRLEELAKDAKSEKVKLDANVEILDRAGFKPPDKVELAVAGIFGSASIEEVRDILRRNLASVESEIQIAKV